MQIFVKVIMGISFMLFLVACGGDAVDTAPQKELSQAVVKTKTAETNTTKEETNTTILPVPKPIVILPNQKIFLLGDSTTFNRSGQQVGWGNRFGDYMKNPENFRNLARGGASSRSYKDFDGWRDWRLTKKIILETNTTDGAYLLIQFGNNDIARNQQEAENLNNKKTMPGRFNTYYTELKEYIDWARAHDIVPVLISPLQAMNKGNNIPLQNIYKRPYGDYAETMRELAKDEDVLLIDLARKSYDVFNSYTSRVEIINDFGVIGARDYTHFRSEGAYKVAGWAKDFICASKDKTLCAQFKE